jgi:hypothetical protein
MHWEGHHEDDSSPAGKVAMERRDMARRSSGGSRAENQWPTDVQAEQGLAEVLRLTTFARGNRKRR